MYCIVRQYWRNKVSCDLHDGKIQCTHLQKKNKQTKEMEKEKEKKCQTFLNVQRHEKRPTWTFTTQFSEGFLYSIFLFDPRGQKDLRTEAYLVIRR